MEEIHNDNPQVEGENKKQDCGCTDGSCQPKKKNIFSKLIFAAIWTSIALLTRKKPIHWK